MEPPAPTAAREPAIPASSNARKRTNSPARSSTSTVTTKAEPKRAIMITSTEWHRRDNDPRLATLQRQEQQNKAQNARKPTAMTTGTVSARPPAGPRNPKKPPVPAGRTVPANTSNGPGYTTEKNGDTRVKGPWTKDEDEMLTRLVKEHGPKKWSAIAQNVPGRIGKQCRERWLNHLDDKVKKTPWTDAEDDVLLKTQHKIGNRWCEISKLLPGRPENAVKNRWNSLMNRRWSQKVYKEQGKNPQGNKMMQDMHDMQMQNGNLRGVGHPINGYNGNLSRQQHSHGIPPRHNAANYAHMRNGNGQMNMPMGIQQQQSHSHYGAYNGQQPPMAPDAQQMQMHQMMQKPSSSQQHPTIEFDSEDAVSLENLLRNSTEPPTVVHNTESWMNPKQEPILESLDPMISPRSITNGGMMFDMGLPGDEFEPMPYTGTGGVGTDAFFHLFPPGGVPGQQQQMLESFSRLSVEGDNLHFDLNSPLNNTPRGSMAGPISPTGSQVGPGDFRLRLSNSDPLGSTDFAPKCLSPSRGLLPGNKFEHPSARVEHKQRFLRQSLGAQQNPTARSSHQSLETGSKEKISQQSKSG